MNRLFTWLWELDTGNIWGANEDKKGRIRWMAFLESFSRIYVKWI